MVDLLYLAGIPAAVIASLVFGAVVARWLGFEDWPVEW